MLVLKLFHGPLSLIFKFYYYRGKWLWLCLRQTYKVTSYFNDREYVTQFSCQLSTSMSKSPSALSKWFSKIIYIYLFDFSEKLSFNPSEISRFVEPVYFAKDEISCFYNSFVYLLQKNSIYISFMPRNMFLFGVSIKSFFLT